MALRSMHLRTLQGVFIFTEQKWQWKTSSGSSTHSAHERHPTFEIAFVVHTPTLQPAHNKSSAPKSWQ